MKRERAKILNALRMGVIPDVALEQLLVGREKELDALLSALKETKEEGISCTKFLKGTYGSGKSFLMNYFKQKALMEGFVVSTISLTSGLNFSRLDSLYTEIMSGLEIQETNRRKGTNFEEIFDTWIKGLKKEKDLTQASQAIMQVISQLNDYSNTFSSVLLTYIRAKISNDAELATIAAAWIKGDQNMGYELKRKLNVKGSVDAENAIHFLRGFSHLVSLIGYAGIVILVDEIELIMNNRVDTRLKAYTNLRYLMDICGNGDLEKCLFVFAGTEELFLDDEKGVKSYDALYQRMGINLAENKNVTTSLRQPVIELTKMTQDQFLQVAQIVFELHRQHYDYETETQLEGIHKLAIMECAKLYKDQVLTMRNYIKKLIELLDLLEKNPKLPIFNTKMG